MSPSSKAIQVTAAIIERDNKIFIARRAPHKHLAGFWEFPGGKIEDGETDDQCLIRELREELGIVVSVKGFFLQNEHIYNENTILLKAYTCDFIEGEISLSDHDQFEWVGTTALDNYKFAPADVPIVRAIKHDVKFKRIVYNIEAFLSVDVVDWGTRLKQHHLDCMNEPASQSQRQAWFDCYNILKRELGGGIGQAAIAQKIYLIFEYELPRERGRRPDVLILSGNRLLVIEFKGYKKETQAHIDQVKHYARDLRSYHKESHNLNVIPILVLTEASNVLDETEGVKIVSGENLHKLFIELVHQGFEDIHKWFDSEYAPLPSLIQSAQLLFKEKSFPQIKRAQSAKIPETIEYLKALAIKAEKERSHHLALITGVPGAGKTLVGLQLVHETEMQDNNQKAVFLSGNGPLVQVLQFSLGNTHLVKGVHDFLKEYAASNRVPSEDIIIYDEAQRAWDAEKAGQRRVNSNAEPTDFINVGSKKSFCLLIGLIGEGQEIHLGEESGMKLWADALLQSTEEWRIHCPENVSTYFDKKNVEIVEEFNLTTSLRTHQAITLQNWVEKLLELEIEQAKILIESLFLEDYPIYLTRNLEHAKEYVNKKYLGESTKTYGIMATSKSVLLPRFGIHNDYNSTQDLRVSSYYVDEQHQSYCRKLTTVVTEFACQGLELDMPILAWDGDWIYDSVWKDERPNRKAKDSFNLRKNSYRVLLTRGRDGLIIYVPNDPVLHNTYQILLQSGCKLL